MGPLGQWLRQVPSKWPHRGQTRMTWMLDRWLRSRAENIATIGGLAFPFLPGEDQREMFYGLFERATARFLAHWLRRGDLFVDAGANVGYFTAIGADRVGPDGRVVAFEPEPSHFRRLQRLVELNPTYRISPENLAVGDTNGPVVLHVSRHAGWHSTIEDFNKNAPRAGKITVGQTSLDRYFLELDRIRLIKVDVEGAEAAVVRGARELLAAQRIDALLVEVTPPSEQLRSEPLEPLFRQMATAGYVPHAHLSGAWRETRWQDVRSQDMILWKPSQRNA